MPPTTDEVVPRKRPRKPGAWGAAICGVTGCGPDDSPDEAPEPASPPAGGDGGWGDGAACAAAGADGAVAGPVEGAPAGAVDVTSAALSIRRAALVTLRIGSRRRASFFSAASKVWGASATQFFTGRTSA